MRLRLLFVLFALYSVATPVFGQEDDEERDDQDSGEGDEEAGGEEEEEGNDGDQRRGGEPKTKKLFPTPTSDEVYVKYERYTQMVGSLIEKLNPDNIDKGAPSPLPGVLAELKDAVDGGHLCGGQCIDGDYELFKKCLTFYYEIDKIDFHEFHTDEMAETVRGSTQEHLMNVMGRAPTDPKLLAQPFHRMKIGVMHSQLWSHLEYYEQLDLATAVAKRAAYGLGLFDSHHQLTDIFNSELYRMKKDNKEPFPDINAYESVTALREMLQKNWKLILQDYLTAVNSELLPGTGYTDVRQGGLLMKYIKKNPTYLTPHPHGIHRGGLWFITIMFAGNRCGMPKAFKHTCKLFKDFQKTTWGGKYKLSMDEVSIVNLNAGTWIRPHTGDQNQQLKVHLGLYNPLNLSIPSGNSSRHWEEGKAFIFDDSFRHEVHHTGSFGDHPRLVMDVKFTHPDMHKVDRLGFETGYKVRYANGTMNTWAMALEDVLKAEPFPFGAERDVIETGLYAKELGLDNAHTQYLEKIISKQISTYGKNDTLIDIGLPQMYCTSCPKGSQMYDQEIIEADFDEMHLGSSSDDELTATKKRQHKLSLMQIAEATKTGRLEPNPMLPKYQSGYLDDAYAEL